MSEIRDFKDASDNIGSKLENCKLAENLDKNKDYDEADFDSPIAKNIEDANFRAPEPGEKGSRDEKIPSLSDDVIVYAKEANDSNRTSDVNENNEAIKNKQDGLAREREVQSELEDKYPPEEGYEILSEVYLRDKDGNIVKDPVTGEARRVDFMVVKDGKVVDSIEVTSKTADKTDQTAKEERIRENGGNYVKDKDGNLVEVPEDVNTRIERRD